MVLCFLTLKAAIGHLFRDVLWRVSDIHTYPVLGQQVVFCVLAKKCINRTTHLFDNQLPEF